MKRILISQRRDMVANRNETRDCLDVRWAKILFDLNLLPILVCSELAEETGYIEQLQPDGILLTGGNDLGSAPKRDELERQLLEYAIDNNLPVLGVCRGMQFINSYLGGGLSLVEGHVATYSKLQGEWSQKNGFIEVNSFHNEAIIEETIAEQLIPLAISSDGVIKAATHNHLPWLGIMWHPERENVLTKADKQLIATHFNKSKS